MSKSRILAMIQEIIYDIRVQNYHVGSQCFQELLPAMQEDVEIRNTLLEIQSPMQEVMGQMLQALEAEDMILLADLLEEALLPIIKEMIVPEEPIYKSKYALEITSSGYLTVKHLPSDLYLHSNGNPMEEARLLINHCYDPQKTEYAVWGVGLGYHIRQLYEASRGSVKITVFDEDEEIIQIAQQNGVLDGIPQEKLSYVVDETGRKFAQYLTESGVGILIHFPSVKKIQNQSLREILHQFFASWNGTIQLRTELAVNYRCNLKNCKQNVDALAELFRKKEVIVVGAGPSLDRSLGFLQENLGQRTIITVTTVLKKLLELGIVPDCTVVMDAQKRTIKQIEGICEIKGFEDLNVPMILDSTAYWEFGERYPGEKYIAYQKEYSQAEKCAAETGNNLYETGGSVTTLALEIALKLGAKAIYFVGVDLAYPGGVSHADNTMDKHTRDTSGMEQVKAVNGEWVYTSSLFNSYRKWIERKIAEHPQVSCYNLSDCGAEIKGAVRYLS